MDRFLTSTCGECRSATECRHADDTVKAGTAAAPIRSLCTTQRNIHWGAGCTFGQGTSYTLTGCLHVVLRALSRPQGGRRPHTPTRPQRTPVPCTCDRPRGGVNPLSFFFFLTKCHLKSLNNSSRGERMGFKTYRDRVNLSQILMQLWGKEVLLMTFVLVNGIGCLFPPSVF